MEMEQSLPQSVQSSSLQNQASPWKESTAYYKEFLLPNSSRLTVTHMHILVSIQEKAGNLYGSGLS